MIVEITDPKLEKVVNLILDSEKYVLFVGAITPERDGQGNNMINWEYIREQVNLEDAGKAVGKLRAEVADDFKKFLDEQEGI